MSINPFLLDEEFNELLERTRRGQRGRGHAELRKLKGPLPVALKQDDKEARPQDTRRTGGRATASLPDERDPAVKAGMSRERFGLVTKLAGLSMIADDTRKRVSKKAQVKAVSRKKLGELGWSFPKGTDAPEGAIRHGEPGDDPNKRVFTSGKGGRTGTAHVEAPLPDEGPHINRVKFQGKGQEPIITHTKVPQTDSDVQALSSTSSSTGGAAGRTGVENSSIGNPGHEAEVRRQEREKALAAKGKNPKDSQKAPDQHPTVQRVQHFVIGTTRPGIAAGTSTAQASLSTTPGSEGNLIGRMRTGAGLGKVGHETRSDADKLKPASTRWHKADNAIKIAQDLIKARVKANKEAAQAPDEASKKK